MVKMIEFHVYGSGTLVSINADAITIVAQYKEDKYDEGTWIWVGGSEYCVTELYHEVLDKIERANREERI